jgi:hypothetical protein
VSEQDQQGQSRRERRRAAEAEAEAEAPGEQEASPAEPQDEPRPTATESIAEENRKARRAAAAKRRAQRDVRERPAPSGLDAGEVVDDALARGTDVTMKWLRRHFNTVQWVLVLGFAGWMAWEIYSWRADKNAAKASDALIKALAAEQEETPRLDQAAEAYRQAENARKGSNTALLAKLGLAGVAYDQGKYGDAITLYQEVAASDLTKADPDARGRALEGVALSLEGKGDLDGALKKLGELENADIRGFGDLARYQKARILHRKGDDAQAKDLLVKLLEKFKKDKPATPSSPMAQTPPSYLEAASRELLERIDPKALPTPSADEALQKALREFQSKLPPGVTMPAPGQAPAMPVPIGPEDVPPPPPEAPPAPADSK